MSSERLHRTAARSLYSFMENFGLFLTIVSFGAINLSEQEHVAVPLLLDKEKVYLTQKRNHTPIPDPDEDDKESIAECVPYFGDLIL